MEDPEKFLQETEERITDEALTDLESKGLPFIETEGNHIYSTSSVLAFLKKMEISQGDSEKGLTEA